MRAEQSKLLEDVLRGAKEVPTLPHVIARILRMTGSPEVNAADVARLISSDPALSAKILRVVNSAFYGVPRKVSSVTQAIVMLGFARVKNLAVTASVAQMFTGMRRPDEFDFRAYWEHAVAAALAAEAVARRAAPICAGEAFVAGLLCEMGRALLAGRAPDRYREVLKAARAERRPLEDVEREMLGFSHSLVGAEVANAWNFPDVLVSALRDYRAPMTGTGDAQVAQCVHVGDALAGALGWLGAGDSFVSRLDGACVSALGLTEETLVQVAGELPKAFAGSSAVLELAA